MLINQVFTLFLQEQKERLSPNTFREYENVIDLFADSLNSYAWNSLPENEGKKVFDSEYEFVEIFDHEQIPKNIDEFLNYFVARKVLASDRFIEKTCPKVVRTLLKWMVRKKFLSLSQKQITTYTCGDYSFYRMF